MESSFCESEPLHAPVQTEIRENVKNPAKPFNLYFPSRWINKECII